MFNVPQVTADCDEIRDFIANTPQVFNDALSDYFNHPHCCLAKSDDLKDFDAKKSFLLGNITQWAVAAAETTPHVPLLPQGTSQTVTFHRSQLRNLLALSVFMPLTYLSQQEQQQQPTEQKSKIKLPTYGILSWDVLYAHGLSPESKQRLICLVHYFARKCSVSSSSSDNDGHYHYDDDPLVVFERVCVSEESWQQQLQEALAGGSSNVCDVAFTGATRIEDLKDAQCHVDFANRQLQIGRNIPSCTQEEVLFSIRPECFISLLIAEMLSPYEVIVIRNAERVATYSGYLGTFAFTGNFVEPKPKAIPEILAIDAVMNMNGCVEIEPLGLETDLRKAVVGFGACRSSTTIGTGNWGCGAFHGTVELKFIQQLLAASLTKKKTLFYSPFSNDSERRVKAIYGVIVAKKMSPAQMWAKLKAFAAWSLAAKRQGVPNSKIMGVTQYFSQ
eukprot:PhM_4_TR6136/c0_g1_i1/m.55772/K07759/PARG; poly(ADP-ribose) glycohydrolase